MHIVKLIRCLHEVSR